MSSNISSTGQGPIQNIPQEEEGSKSPKLPTLALYVETIINAHPRPGLQPSPVSMQKPPPVPKELPFTVAPFTPPTAFLASPPRMLGKYGFPNKK